MTNFGIGGIGLHIFIAIFFAIHAVRSGREIYWLLILFLFPLLGSLVYFFAVFLPDLKSGRLHYGLHKVANKVANAAVTSLDPGRELREAKAAFDLTPTAKNQWRYADALLAADKTAEAVAQFEQCLQGPSANDLEIQFAAANAHFKFNQPEKALKLLLAIRQNNPSFRTEAVTFLLARIYALQGNKAAAKTEFEHVVARFGSVEQRVEYAIWAAQHGDIHTANHLYAELIDLKKHWNTNARAMYLPLMKKLDEVMQEKKR
jgi:hypothetical protein